MQTKLKLTRATKVQDLLAKNVHVYCSNKKYEVVGIGVYLKEIKTGELVELTDATVKEAGCYVVLNWK